jgi:hypothetical protein
MPNTFRIDRTFLSQGPNAGKSDGKTICPRNTHSWQHWMNGEQRRAGNDRGVTTLLWVTRRQDAAASRGQLEGMYYRS